MNRENWMQKKWIYIQGGEMDEWCTGETLPPADVDRKQSSRWRRVMGNSRMDGTCSNGVMEDTEPKTEEVEGCSLFTWFVVGSKL